jgi:ABC-2 type transport system permease protein
MLIAGVVLGVHLEWAGVPLALAAILLVVACYLALGVVAAAAVLIFRTSGPFVPGIVAGTSLLGGVYYSTSVIPSWIQSVSAVVPLTYGLRAIRRLLLDGASLETVWFDLSVLTVFTVGLSLLAAATFAFAMRYAKRAGTLSHY